MAHNNLKPHRITNIKVVVPLIIDLNQLNSDAWRVLFYTNCKAYDVYDNLDGTSNPKDDKDEA